ncbi:urea carboxylase [Granulosicoccaceae sp. 1_MG-2023]|nr:urea carboxylase [Granulosicoccaceae sp. 1_MG-2023]
MFNKVLIANRGAIATRIIRTLKEMNIRAVVVYAECDRNSLHVREADEAYSLGEGNAADTYLNTEKLLSIALECGAQAIHPGYGFLSENAEFVERCDQSGLCFIGPTADQIRAFGLKHRARELAIAAGVPLLPGTDLLRSLDEAVAAAADIGYPVMLKTTAGGGGIGMSLCDDEAALREAFESVRRLGANNFADDGVFLEKYIARARHIEVQVIGDGQGMALALGERDCSAQRRNQKVVEECPAPGLSDATRTQLRETAESLLSRIQYRNAGTVEFIMDTDTGAFYFLEVNTRLQVEHGVTEEVYGVDLVRWMLQVAAGTPPDFAQLRQPLQAHGHAIQVRVYAEDPYHNFRPAPGLLSDVRFPEGDGIRIDHWIESGIEVPPYFDPMLAKIIVHAGDRAAALSKLADTLANTGIYGTPTNLDYLRALCDDPVLHQAGMTTTYLNRFHWQPCRIDVLQAGTQTTVQDYPGRSGYWDVGVPPSGAFDHLAFRLGNRLLGNPQECAGLEMVISGPHLLFSSASRIVISGAPIEATLDDKPLAMNTVHPVSAGSTLKLGKIEGPGARAYLSIVGGIQCPPYLGSRSTFTLGQFGGHNGRALQTGDVLHITADETTSDCSASLPEGLYPAPTGTHELRVIYGPHGAPDFFTDKDIATFFATDWEVHYNSSRTGIRLIGPKPEWARKDGGEAGLHPSNLHDNAYAFGTVDFTGDMPVILGPDGPSLGGFVCPATVITADLWKLGQLRAGDKLRFVPVSIADAVAAEQAQLKSIETLEPQAQHCTAIAPHSPVLHTLPAAGFNDEITLRAAGDHFLLIEYGDMTLDIRLRFRAHALWQWLQDNPLAGLRELTPGIRSLQVHFDSQRLSHQTLIAHITEGENALSRQLDSLTVPSRIVYLPLSWDDEACRQAIEKYDQSVRKNAPWCPSNLEFIRRINGLDSIDDVKAILFDASYLVMGLGDVYLGAPVATPVDPRHRLVTTKYNPARTWTAENSVGIGGSYLCVYGMEGPGGYQFVGRTLQMWNRYRRTREFTQPWLLRFFDQIRFYEVSHDELQQIRRDFPQGRYPLRIEETTFSLNDYEAFVQDNQPAITRFRQQREAAFAAELANWHATGQFNYEAQEAAPEEDGQNHWAENTTVVDSPVAGSVWQSLVSEGDSVSEGQIVTILESMKMEIPVYASQSGTIGRLLRNAGDPVRAGQALLTIEEA